MKYLIWLAFFIPAIIIELFCYLTAPIAALFVRMEYRKDVVKRYQKAVMGFDREYLRGWFYLWQTHDNAVDEWWWGVYNVDHWFKFARKWNQEDYDGSWWVRYYCRLIWLWRNCGYGFHYALFSKPKETLTAEYTKGTEDKTFWYSLKVFPSSFQLECQIPFKTRYVSVNIGWKAHKETARLLYANRLIGTRRY